MRPTICLIAALALVPAAAPVSAKAAAKPAAFEINHTSWSYTEKGKSYRESIDENGNFVTHLNGKEVDHGTAVMKDGKACFTSAVDKSGEVCWVTHPVAIGHSMLTHSDKGEKLMVHRLAYMPMKAK
jgi:hypothetical protein